MGALDPPLGDKLRRLKADHCHFAYRMVMVLMRRELPLDQVGGGGGAGRGGGGAGLPACPHGGRERGEEGGECGRCRSAASPACLPDCLPDCGAGKLAYVRCM